VASKSAVAAVKSPFTTSSKIFRACWSLAFAGAAVDDGAALDEAELDAELEVEDV
jgi:hypothetical protein